jgi:transforming growth factor-beta-induced protein
LVGAVVAGDLADTLSSPGPFTVFAPTNKAFAALPAGVLQTLMKPENKKELVDILTYHVLPEKVLSTDLKASQVVKTVEGKPLHVTKSGNHVRVGASLKSKDLRNVIKADNVASNGVVHIIDGVLLPPSSTAIGATSPTPASATKNIVQLAESVDDLSTLVAAVVAGDLADTLSSPGPFTVFAPTNEAFAALPASVLAKLMKPENKKELIDILTYHVLPEKVLSTDLKASQVVKTVEGKPLHVTKSGNHVRVGASLKSKDLRNVIKADNVASNGVVHIIDGVLLPPSSTAIRAASPTPASATKNIVQLAESVDDLSTLVAAVVAGDLADTLSSPGPFTVFAPTNEAFAALPPSVLAKLMKPENKKELVDILTYHVLPEKVLSTDLKASQVVKTVEGKPLHVTKTGNHVRVGASLKSKDLRNVIKADNVASNGVVHIIDGVLLPPSSTATEIIV